MFRPMALTVVFALIGSLILALTLMPVLASLGLNAHAGEHEPRVIHWLKARYRPLLHRAIANPLLTGGAAAAVFVVSLVLVPFMGAEFIPKLDEGAVALQAWRLPSVALSESVARATLIEKTLKSFPRCSPSSRAPGKPRFRPIRWASRPAIFTSSSRITESGRRLTRRMAWCPRSTRRWSAKCRAAAGNGCRACAGRRGREAGAVAGAAVPAVQDPPGGDRALRHQCVTSAGCRASDGRSRGG